MVRALIDTTPMAFTWVDEQSQADRIVSRLDVLGHRSSVPTNHELDCWTRSLPLIATPRSSTVVQAQVQKIFA